MSITELTNLTESEHEKVVVITEPSIGLHGVIAIHNTKLGPALGGCRVQNYPTEAAAIKDALLLSQGMTYKNALAELPFGGGKACLISKGLVGQQRIEVFKAFAEYVESLDGQYITAEDLGTTVSDVMTMRSVTKHACCFATEIGGSGDPSPWTARGLFKAILAAAQFRYYSNSLREKSIYVEGVGKVGYHLIQLLSQAGCKIYASDLNAERLEIVVNEFGVEPISLNESTKIKVNIFSPCAIGQTVNIRNLNMIDSEIIAGGANNQIADDLARQHIMKKKITYCPDFAANAGGVIAAAGEFRSTEWDENWVKEKIDNLYHTIYGILLESTISGRFAEDIAIGMARRRLDGYETSEDITVSNFLRSCNMDREIL